MEATYTLDDVAQHKSKDDCWIAVDGGVYDVTDFLPIHPGGNILLSVAGTDATDFFTELHREGVLEEVRASTPQSCLTLERARARESGRGREGARSRKRAREREKDGLRDPCTLVH